MKEEREREETEDREGASRSMGSRWAERMGEWKSKSWRGILGVEERSGQEAELFGMETENERKE